MKKVLQMLPQAAVSDNGFAWLDERTINQPGDVPAVSIMLEDFGGGRGNASTGTKNQRAENKLPLAGEKLYNNAHSVIHGNTMAMA
jgi:hypothetical protein